ncbi:MAG: ABC transporter ATP-binding protein [Nitrospiraceae bacterium]|nr:ABC transporter ATP-binding protein [Nitrospiraceae bacterium]
MQTDTIPRQTPHPTAEEVFSRRFRSALRYDMNIYWELSKPHFGRFVAAVIAGALLSASNGLIAWAAKPVVDLFLIGKDMSMQYLLPLGILVLFTLRGGFTFATNYLMSSIGAKMVKMLRDDIYRKLLRMPSSYMISASSGSLISKLLNDLSVLHNTMAYTIRDFFVEGGTAIVLIVVAVVRRWDMALLAFVVLPLIVLSIGKLGKLMKKTSMATRKMISRVTIILHETLQGMKIIKAFTMERTMAERNRDALQEHYRNTMREVRIDEMSRFLADVLGGLGLAATAYYAFSLIAQDRMTPGDFVSFLVAIMLVYTPLKRMSKVYNNFQQSRPVIERIREILQVQDEPSGGIEKSIQGEIVLSDVSFTYPSAREAALRHINLTIRPGEIVAVVGHSGAGKSTLVDIIGGFWHPTDGTIAIDGTDMRDLSVFCLRSHLGLVTQEVVLFDDTIKANIRYGRPEATDDEVIAAATAAFAHDFIMELPEGYDTMIGERGARLSGGQKQRLTIARAILRNPSILILDEATSSLDTESERMVQAALENLMIGRTTIVIAHRLSTVQKANRIVVMSQGSIVQQGTHEELLAQDGLYRELHAMQFADEEKRDTSTEAQS